ncbi:V-type ATP synthase subunit C [Candidatus Lokiarchaeum ossiferum]|uniref:V-type ATP synthase subunit C n=1 Tax=Candidatus Lokiarchaeum ossiferum TaxID=2951803 RepID=A0ABY6HZ45_9ARCH|nr:V-type ATP synthase subunit C [Candidatus Lokiarchaeum sp. B-35]
MKVTIDDYGFIFVRLSVIKSLLMSEDDLSKLASIGDLESLGIYTKRFFPSFSPEENTVWEYEWTLWNTYFAILEKILIAAPHPIQIFLKSLLVKYEILNLKICIYGVIEQTSLEDRYHRVFDRPSKILERYDFLKRLLIMKNFEDLIKAVHSTPYRKIVEEGVQKFKESGDIFYLEHSLDKFYYTNMIEKSRFFPHREKNFIEGFIRAEIDYNSLNLIYRALFNGISLELIKPYVISNGLLFKHNEIKILITSSSIHDFIIKLKRILKKQKDFAIIPEKLSDPNPDVWSWLSEFFLNKYLERFQTSIVDDIPLISISLIFKLLLLKQNEIKRISARAIQISLAEEKY